MKDGCGGGLGNRLILNQADSEFRNQKQLVSEISWQHKPSIGILLVPHKDKLEVEYALRTASKSIGVAQYTLSKKLPKELLGKLPSEDDFKQILVNDGGKEL